MSDEFVGYLPEDFTDGGLAMVGAVVECKDVRFEMFDYGGKSEGGPVPCLAVSYEDVNSGEDYGRQFYSAGNPQSFLVDDGELKAAFDGAKIRRSSNYAVWITELLNAGFPADMIKGGIKKITGTKVRLVEVPAPKFQGEAQKRKGKDGKEYDKTIIVAGEIIGLPGEKPKAEGAPNTGKKKGAGKSAAPAEVDDEMTEALTQFVIRQLAESGGEAIKAKDLPSRVVKDPEFAKGPFKAKRAKLMNMVHSAAFLEAGAWSYADGEVSMDAELLAALVEAE